MEIVPQYEENMVSAGLTDSTKMTFSTDVAHLFALLSKNLYGNPQLAAVREIITNAWDAHIEAGKTDTPIRIRNDGDSFVIQDFGPGLAPDKFLELYGVVGGSSKREDNRQTGGMGIGKMAPLATMSHFSVKSHYNGTATIYHIAGPTEESGGIPSITKVVELPTDITGLEVIFPVSISAFKNHIKDVVCMGAIKAEYESRDEITLLETTEDTDFVYQSKDGWRNLSTYLRYGNISYGFSSYKMLNHVPSSRKLWDLLETFDMEIIVKLQPGVAVVTPNREDLVITDKLKEYLEVRLEEAYQDAIKTIRKTLTSGAMEVEKCYPYHRDGSMIATTKMESAATKCISTSYFSCHKPSISLPSRNRLIIPELRSAAVASFNKSIPKSFHGIHKPSVMNKLEKSFKKLIYKSGLTLKHAYTLQGTIPFSFRRNHDSSFLYDLARNRKIVIHYRRAVNMEDRKGDILYIRIPMKVDADKLKSRLECLFGKEIDIQIWKETLKKEPKVSNPKVPKETKYVCASALIGGGVKYYLSESVISSADKTVEDPKVVLAVRDVEHTTQTFLRFLGEKAIKEAGIVLVHNTTAGAMLRRKKPPMAYSVFMHSFITDFLKKPEVIEFFEYAPIPAFHRSINTNVKQLLKEILDINLKISEEDLQFLSWVCSNHQFRVQDTVTGLLSGKDKPENVEFVNRLASSNLVNALEEFNIYDAAIAELRKQHK